MINLDSRLSCAAEMVEPCDTLCDIGADHAYLALNLLLIGKVKRAFITDINKGPLDNAKKNTVKYGLSESCDFLLGDGLNPLDNLPVDLITICGMGGELIQKILSQKIEYVKTVPQLILQPMNGIIDIRKYLEKEHFKITKEAIIKDGYLYYFIIKTKYEGNKEPVFIIDELDYEFPPSLISDKNPVMLEYLNFKLNEELKIGKNLQSASDSSLLKNNLLRIERIKERIFRYDS